MRLKTVFGFAVGPLGLAGVGLITVPLISWLFSPADVGRLNLLQVTLSFGLLLTTLGLDQAYVREYHGHKNTTALLKSCFAPGFIVLCLCAVLTVPFSERLTLWLYGSSDSSFYWITLFCVIVNFVVRFLSLILRMEERGFAFSLSQLIPKSVQLLLLGVVFWWGIERNFSTLLWISLISISLVAFVLAWSTRNQWVPVFETPIQHRQVGHLLKYGFPLVFSGLVYWGLTATSTLVLRGQSSLSELGVYAVTSSIAGVAAVFQSIFTVIWGPVVYKWVNEGADVSHIDRVASKALFLICAAFVMVGCFSSVVDYLLPEDYYSVKYLVVCGIAPPLLYALSEVMSVGIGVTRRTTLVFWVTLFAFAFNIVLNLLLVPRWGAAGAVTSNALAYMFYFVARTEVSVRVWRIFPRFRIYFYVTLFVSLAIFGVWLGPLLSFSFAFFWLLMIPVFMGIFRRDLVESIDFLKSLLIKNKIN